VACKTSSNVLAGLKQTFSRFSRLQLAGLLLALCIWLSMTYVITPPETLSQPAWAATKIMFMMIVIWMTDALPSGVCAFLIVISLALTNATDFGTTITPTTKLQNALVGFSAKETWLIAAAFILGMAVLESGLGRRITYTIMSVPFFARSFEKFMFGFGVVQLFVGPFIPSSTAKAGIFIPLGQGVLATLGIKPYTETNKRSNNASGLLIHTAWMTNTVGSMFATGTVGIVTGLALLATVSKGAATISWGDYFIAMAPVITFLFIGSWYVMIKMFPPEINEIPGGVEVARERFESLGPLTGVEIRTGLIFIATLLMWIFEKKIGIDSTTTALIACLLLLAPVTGFGVKDKDVLKRLGWDAILLLAAGLSLSTVLTKTGAATWIAKVLFGGMGMETWSPISLIAFYSAVMFVSHLGFAGNTAHKLAMIPIVITSAMSLGLNPLWVGLPAILASTNAFILHTMSPPNVIAYGTGYFPLMDMIKSGTVVTVLCWVIIVVFAVFWFPLVGIPVYK